MKFLEPRSDSIHLKKLRVFRNASSVKISLFLPFIHRILMLLLVSFLSFALITIQKGFELSNVKSCSMLLFSTRCRPESADIFFVRSWLRVHLSSSHFLLNFLFLLLFNQSVRHCRGGREWNMIRRAQRQSREIPLMSTTLPRSQFSINHVVISRIWFWSSCLDSIHLV